MLLWGAAASREEAVNHGLIARAPRGAAAAAAAASAAASAAALCLPTTIRCLLSLPSAAAAESISPVPQPLRPPAARAPFSGIPSEAATGTPAAVVAAAAAGHRQTFTASRHPAGTPRTLSSSGNNNSSGRSSSSSGRMATLLDGASYRAFCQREGPKAVLFFSPGDAPSQQLLQLLPMLEKDFPSVSFGAVDASSASECLRANALVSRSPTVNFMWVSPWLSQLVGSDVPRLVSCLKALSASPSAAAAGPALQQQLGNAVETEEQLQQRLAALVKRHPVMLFMKGKREQPFCRFSKAIIALLDEQGVKNFDTFDVFEDSAVREGLKKFSDWPTYPQLYVNGELVGGLDVLKSMVADGSFREAFPPSAFDS
ncbi:hypothetical protein Efla_002565 [Eimeria flavescens]